MTRFRSPLTVVQASSEYMKARMCFCEP